MKRLAVFFLSVMLVLGPAACAGPGPAVESETARTSTGQNLPVLQTGSTAADTTASAAPSTEGTSAPPSSRRTAASRTAGSTPARTTASSRAATFSVSTAASTAPAQTQAPASSAQPAGRNIPVVYFSWSSNTERMAEYIRSALGADLYEIEPATAYPTDYTACTQVALEERDSNARPAIRNAPESVEQYDSIFIGYPIWWHTAPMIIGTFLESYDLSGVDVYPFTQSASMDEEQFQNSMEFVRECAGNADVHDGLFARPSAMAEIDAYLTENGFSVS